jgi:hypothetical protein
MSVLRSTVVSWFIVYSVHHLVISKHTFRDLFGLSCGDTEGVSDWLLAIIPSKVLASLFHT